MLKVDISAHALLFCGSTKHWNELIPLRLWWSSTWQKAGVFKQILLNIIWFMLIANVNKVDNVNYINKFNANCINKLY